MKKQLLTLILAAVLVLCTSLPAGAYTDAEKNTADALYQLGVFIGYGDTYGLDDYLSRYQGYVLMIRLLGVEEEAKKCTASVPFTDVDAAWAMPYVAYAYATGLTKGMDATHFGGSFRMSTRQFATLCLRALGYDDGADGDFAYALAAAFAMEKGIKTPDDDTLDRGGCVIMLWDTLNALRKNSTVRLSQDLISKGVFTARAFADAKRIKREGISAGDMTGEKGTDKPSGGGTDKPSGGGTDKPSGGGTDKPSGGGTDKPSGGGTDTPGGGGTDTPSGGETDPETPGGSPGTWELPPIPI